MAVADAIPSTGSVRALAAGHRRALAARYAPVAPDDGAAGVWRSLVAHSLWVRGVVGSNPATPTARARDPWSDGPRAFSRSRRPAGGATGPPAEPAGHRTPRWAARVRSPNRRSTSPPPAVLGVAPGGRARVAEGGLGSVRRGGVAGPHPAGRTHRPARCGWCWPARRTPPAGGSHAPEGPGRRGGSDTRSSRPTAPSPRCSTRTAVPAASGSSLELAGVVWGPLVEGDACV